MANSVRPFMKPRRKLTFKVIMTLLHERFVVL